MVPNMDAAVPLGYDFIAGFVEFASVDYCMTSGSSGMNRALERGDIVVLALSRVSMWCNLVKRTKVMDCL